MDPLEPLVIPEDLSTLSDDELAALADEVTERATLLSTDDALLAELGSDAVALIENAIAADESVAAEKTRREEAAAEAAQILEETRARLAARLNPAGGDEDDDEEPGAGDGEEDDELSGEGEGEGEGTPPAKPEPVLVAAAKPKPNRALRRSAAHEPLDGEGEKRGPKLMALSSLPGSIEAGSDMNRKDMARLISEKWNRMHVTDGPREDIPLARYSVEFPEDRVLIDGDDAGNMTKLDAVVGEEALVASGGLCAPVEPYYDLQLLSTEATPVIDSLPLFGADRGGIRFMAPPTIANISTAVGVMTAANDAIGGTTATKTCQTLPCPAQTQVVIDAVYHCLTIGNMGARTWPELVENFMALTMAAHARVRETKALDAIKTGSTAVTGAQYNGAVNTLLAQINYTVDAFRSRHRMNPDARFRAWFPEWTKGLLLNDLIRQQFDRFDALESGNARNFVVDYLRSLGVEPVFFLDGETGGGQVFGTQNVGALLNYPSTVKWYIAPEGTWIRLNGGVLDLGIVRDSVLNATNDFQAFGEVFENYAKIGIESLAVTSTVCANGVVSAPAAPSGC